MTSIWAQIVVCIYAQMPAVYLFDYNFWISAFVIKDRNIRNMWILPNQMRMLFELCYMTEEFVTPLSTPPSEAEDATAVDTGRHSELGESVTSGLSESAIYDKIYET